MTFLGPIPEHIRICGVPIEPLHNITSRLALIRVRGPFASVANSAPVHTSSPDPESEDAERTTRVQSVLRRMVRFGRCRTDVGRKAVAAELPVSQPTNSRQDVSSMYRVHIFRVPELTLSLGVNERNHMRDAIRSLGSIEITNPRCIISVQTAAKRRVTRTGPRVCPT